MSRADDSLALLNDLYAAPGTTEGWLQFLDRLRVAADGSACSLIAQTVDPDGFSVSLSTLVDNEAFRSYSQHWGGSDPWAHSPKWAHLSGRQVIVGDELIAHRDMRRTEYYQEFGRRYDLVRALIAVVETRVDALSVISVSGSERRGSFDPVDATLLEPLVPHIRRAVQLHRRLMAASTATVDFASAIDELSRGVVLIDRAGQVVFMNRTARILVATGDGLTIENGELRASRAADTARLRTLVAGAARTSSGATGSAGGLLAIGRPSGRRCLLLLVAPTSQRRPLVPTITPAAAVVFVTDPEQAATADIEHLREVFRFTPAEAQLTQLLAQGRTLNEIASHLGITREAVRSRLKIIFKKTDTARQADLVRLALNA